MALVFFILLFDCGWLLLLLLNNIDDVTYCDSRVLSL